MFLERSLWWREKEDKRREGGRREDTTQNPWWREENMGGEGKECTGKDKEERRACSPPTTTEKREKRHQRRERERKREMKANNVRKQRWCREEWRKWEWGAEEKWRRKMGVNLPDILWYIIRLQNKWKKPSRGLRWKWVVEEKSAREDRLGNEGRRKSMGRGRKREWSTTFEGEGRQDILLYCIHSFPTLPSSSSS